jgi:predicted dehydrogenase
MDTPELNAPMAGSLTTTRREFLKTAGAATAVSALAGVKLPHVHAAESGTVRVALIGCGGRGTGAANNALSVKNGPMELTAMADVFDHRLKGSYEALKRAHESKVAVPPDRMFIGLDAYKAAIDTLKPGDVAIFTTPPAFRWVHFAYAIQKGVNVFMEKPVTVDGPSSRRMLQLGEEATRKNLKVGVGLMVRHCRGRQQLKKRIEDGEIGDIVNLRAYRMHGPVGFAFSGPKPDDLSHTMYQIQRFHSFLWASGGLYSDFYIHQVDECCWMKGEWPVRAQANGGRHYRGDAVDQNFDNYSVEYTFADGAKFFFYGRTISGCKDDFSSYAHATKGSAVISGGSHSPGRVRTFRTQNVSLARNNPDIIWAFPQPEPDPYQMEWEDLMEAIRNDTPYNEVQRGVEASLVTSMGRMAAHTGQEITYDQILNSTHEFAPDLDKLEKDSPAPLMPGEDGLYPVPEPGRKKDREY